jgi:membrane-bound lytic murein transglycosylase B
MISGTVPKHRMFAFALLWAALAPAVRAAPPPSAPIPRDPAALARALTRTTDDLEKAVARWRPARRPPRSVTLTALHEQRIYRFLSRRPRLSAATIARLPSRLRSAARDIVGARVDLERLATPVPRHAIRVGPPRPAATLLGFYREAERRFGVPWSLLAAVNFVESAFGRVRSSSAAGAQGPMQFLPSTWRAYGLGGDVHDPHDAILGAANYLRANGASRDLRRALLAYNRSPLYVDAVLRFARRMRGNVRRFEGFYAWQVFVGDRRLTGPGRKA